MQKQTKKWEGVSIIEEMQHKNHINNCLNFEHLTCTNHFSENIKNHFLTKKKNWNAKKHQKDLDLLTLFELTKDYLDQIGIPSWLVVGKVENNTTRLTVDICQTRMNFIRIMMKICHWFLYRQQSLKVLNRFTIVFSVIKFTLYL